MTMTIEERVAVLEAGQKQTAIQLSDLSGKVDDIHELSASIKVIAAETQNISTKVDKIDDRLSDVEKKDVKAFTHYKQLIVGCLITGVLTAIITAIITAVVK